MYATLACYVIPGALVLTENDELRLVVSVATQVMQLGNTGKEYLVFTYEDGTWYPLHREEVVQVAQKHTELQQ